MQLDAFPALFILTNEPLHYLVQAEVVLNYQLYFTNFRIKLSLLRPSDLVAQGISFTLLMQSVCTMHSFSSSF